MEKVIFFPDGLLGFPEQKRYLLLDYKDTPIKWLQSVEDPDIAFIVVEPTVLFPNFSITIDSPIRKYLGLRDDDDGLIVLLIIRVENESVIANVSGPLMFNVNLMRGVQVVNDRPVIE